MKQASAAQQDIRFRVLRLLQATGVNLILVIASGMSRQASHPGAYGPKSPVAFIDP